MITMEKKIKILETHLTNWLNTLTPFGDKSYQIKNIMNHLKGVAKILKAQDAPDYLIDAGLFHSVYGEVHNRTASMTSIFTREELIDVIGEMAEEIVYRYATIPFNRSINIKNMSDGIMKINLRWLDIANETDQYPQNDV
jgi:hypothetical protein